MPCGPAVLAIPQPARLPVPSASYTHARLGRHGDHGGRTPALAVGTGTPGGLKGRKATAPRCSGREMVSLGSFTRAQGAPLPSGQAQMRIIVWAGTIPHPGISRLPTAPGMWLAPGLCPMLTQF